METNILFIIIAILSIFIISLQIQVLFLRRRIRDLFGKEKGKDIEQVLNDYVKGVSHYFEDVEELKKFSQKLFHLVSKSIQKIGFIRFNPFDDVGGDQSFSIALLDLNNDGILISSLFGRDGTRVYSKPITSGKSKYFLSHEEEKALEEAIKNNRSLDVSQKK
ncbi:DUF4446 domain-containing protein [bacterium CG_4_10_14_0_2_um_filter_33_32]|nr:MAG: hypothetical protein AUJ93_00370 [bacterium CG2_30_33_46]PIR67775.1 MAG: DUF4446 domain-containing protein [bacterium CG10_big_fil_rev_8_21_14_0_10_33_18]PIU76801.1 MAG: DUF4446 domain-containing protein [bacterium CG06_land_8_20_14_3_00_33_50]PIW81601.1 MAG: DUF4446 domain-containing protein [bacterium CG_4_8_14_3_um_filter_33_28]PIY85541.1 MAG: DUF4446 domain-containing protein [bacterium CG_4_10_14_0_8_um_filter_33_57]PIZ85520.1 MAG: DUF4446 domain-containing protein [bacterium CG_4